MSATIRCLCAGIVIACWCLGIARSQDSVPTAEFVFAGIKDSKERLRTYAFRGIGTVIDEDTRYGRLEGKVEVAAAFDYSKELFRFDRTEAVRVSPSGGDVINPKDWVVGYETAKFVKTAKRTINWYVSARPDVIVGPATARPDTRVKPFDIRIIGFCTYGNVMRNTSLEEHMAYLESVKNATVSREADGTLKVKWSSPGATEVVIVDEKNGYLPLRAEVRLTRPGVDQLSEVTEAQWKKVNGVWVPKQIGYSSYGGGRKDHVKSYDLKLEWDHVNKPVPEEIFTVQGLHVSPGLTILSTETGKSVTLGKTGDKDYEPASINSDIFGDGSRLRRRLWIGGGIAAMVLLAVGGYLLRRRQLQRRALAI